MRIPKGALVGETPSRETSCKPQSVRWERETVARQAPAVPVRVDNIRSSVYSVISSLATGVFHLHAAERQEDHDGHCACEPLSWIVRRPDRPPDPEAFSPGQYPIASTSPELGDVWRELKNFALVVELS
jgi:hypothetical protein